MIWLYRSPINVKRKGSFTRPWSLLPAFAVARLRGGGRQHPVVSPFFESMDNCHCMTERGWGGLPAASGHELALPGQLLHQARHHRLLPSLKETVSQELSVLLRIRIYRIRMFLGLPNPDPLVQGMDPASDPSVIKQKQ
jgi:hypothetical protein